MHLKLTQLKIHKNLSSPIILDTFNSSSKIRLNSIDLSKVKNSPHLKNPLQIILQPVEKSHFSLHYLVKELILRIFTLTFQHRLGNQTNSKVMQMINKVLVLIINLSLRVSNNRLTNQHWHQKMWYLMSKVLLWINPHS